MNTVSLIVLVNLAVLLLLALFAPHLMIVPGRLIDAHADLTSDCFACHTPFMGSTPEKCIECHPAAQIGIMTTKGLSIAGEKKDVAFHQGLIEQDCVACHSDHRGVQAFRPISRFSHRLLEPATHTACGGCHRKPQDALHKKILGNCSACHTEEGWTPATFDHDRYFRFDRHHTTECITCHVDDDYNDYTCYGCHEHSRSKIRREHVEEGIRDYESCVECHRSGNEHEAKHRARPRRTKSRDSEPRFHRRDHGRAGSSEWDDD